VIRSSYASCGNRPMQSVIAGRAFVAWTRFEARGLRFRSYPLKREARGLDDGSLWFPQKMPSPCHHSQRGQDKPRLDLTRPPAREAVAARSGSRSASASDKAKREPLRVVQPVSRHRHPSQRTRPRPAIASRMFARLAGRCLLENFSSGGGGDAALVAAVALLTEHWSSLSSAGGLGLGVGQVVQKAVIPA